MFATKFNINTLQNLPFFNWLDVEIGLGLLIFCIAIIFVVISATLAPRLLIRIFERTKITKGFIAVIFIAVITSAPELISIISSPHAAGSKGIVWAFSNVFGANLLAAVMIMFFQLFFFQQIRHNPKFKIILWTIPFILLFNVFYFLLLLFPEAIIGLKISPLPTLFSFLIVLIYVLLTIFLYFYREPKTLLKVQKKRKEKVENHTFLSFFGLIIFTLLIIGILIFSMLVLISLSTLIENNIQNPIFTGGIVIALVTIFPEILSALSFFLIGMFASGIGVFIGSQLFNMVLLIFLVEFNGKELTNPDFFKYQPIILAMLFSVMIANIILFFNYKLINFKRNIVFYVCPILIFQVFIFFWVFSWIFNPN